MANKRDDERQDQFQETLRQIWQTNTELMMHFNDIGIRLNKSFPKFMDENTFVGKKRGEIISAGREVVGRTGMFKDVKKRYAIHVLDK